jgi:hypothetical protein
MVRRALSWALVLVVACTASPLFAQAKSPLTAIPGDAAVVLRIKGYQGLLKKVGALADAVKPGTGQQVQLGGGFVAGGLIKNGTLEGVDLDGEFFVAIYAEKEKEPGFVFVVPGKDLAAMKEAMGDTVTFVEVGKHGVYSADEELINAVKEQIKSKEKDSILDAIDAKSAAVLNRGDISVFVNVPHLLSVYKNEFAMAQGAAENISNTEPPPNAPPGMNWSGIMTAVQGFATKLLKAVEDHKGITVAISFSDKDVVIENYFKLDDKSDSGKALKGGTGSDMPLLTTLPADSVVFFSLQCDMNEFASHMMEFSASVIEDEKVRESLKDVVKEMSGLKFNGVAGAFNLNGSATDGAARAVTVANVNDPQKVRAITKKYVSSVKAFEANNVKSEVSYKPDAEKIGSVSIDQTVTKITVSDDGPDAEKQKKIMKFIYGDGPVTGRMAFLKDKIISTVGGGKAGMEGALKSLDTKTQAASIQAARGKLGAEPNFVGLVDLANLAVQGMKLAKAMDENLPFDPVAMTKGLNLKASYIGFAVEVEDAAVSTKTVITLDQIKSIGELVNKAIAAQQGR